MRPYHYLEVFQNNQIAAILMFQANPVGFESSLWAPIDNVSELHSSGFWIPFLAGSWIPKAGFWIPEPSIPDSTSKNFSWIPESGLPYMGRLVSKLPCTPLGTFKSRKGKCLSFSRSRGNWIDGSTEFKCDERRSASFPDTAEITSSTYRFQKKGFNRWSGQGPLFHVFHYHVSNDSRDGRTHRETTSKDTNSSQALRVLGKP